MTINDEDGPERLVKCALTGLVIDVFDKTIGEAEDGTIVLRDALFGASDEQ